MSIGGGYQDDVDDIDDDEDDENAIIDVEDYKIPAITIKTAIPSTQTSSGISQSAHQNTNGSTSSKNRIGRPTKSSVSSPVSSSTASDDERLSPDSVKVRNHFTHSFPFLFFVLQCLIFICDSEPSAVDHLADVGTFLNNFLFRNNQFGSEDKRI